MAQRILCGLAVLVLTTTAQAQTYPIKIKMAPDEGQTVLSREVDKLVHSDKVLDATGKVVKDDKSTLIREVETTSKVLKGGDKPQKYTRTFTKAVVGNGKNEQKLPYSGRTILFELKEGKYVLTAEGEPELDPTALAELTLKANVADPDFGKFLAPAKEVAVGDTWQLDSKKVAQQWAQGNEVDVDKVKATGKLVKAYKKDDQQWGVIDVAMKIPYKGFRNIKLSDPSVLELNLTIDAPIDGSSPAGSFKATGGLTVKGETEAGGVKYTVDSKLDLNNERTTTVKK